jgi:hypothetical protein
MQGSRRGRFPKQTQAGLFAAARLSAYGTKRTFRPPRLMSASEAKRTLPTDGVMSAHDPFLPFDNQFCCDAQRGATESSLGIAGPIQVSDWPL